ncbi:MAG: hypothetical protein ACPGWR_21440 [Ardenticatenaceae bacterium]
MTLITIREKGTNEAVISFDHRGEYVITVTDPFSTEDRRRLAWYFSEYMRFPFAKQQKKAQEVARSIAEYGHALFSMVFQSDMGLYARYYQARQAGELRFEIVGSPQFHALHWEALKDPDLPRPFALRTKIKRL